MEKVSIQASVALALKKLGYHYVRVSDTGILSYCASTSPYSWERVSTLSASNVDDYGYFDLVPDVLYCIAL